MNAHTQLLIHANFVIFSQDFSRGGGEEKVPEPESAWQNMKKMRNIRFSDTRY